MPGPGLSAGADRGRRAAPEGARPGYRYRGHPHAPGEHSRDLRRWQPGGTDRQTVAPGALRLAGGTAQDDHPNLEGAHRALFRPGGAPRAPAEYDGAPALGASLTHDRQAPSRRRRTEIQTRYSDRPA